MVLGFKASRCVSPMMKVTQAACVPRSKDALSVSSLSLNKEQGPVSDEDRNVITKQC